MEVNPIWATKVLLSRKPSYELTRNLAQSVPDFTLPNDGNAPT